MITKVINELLPTGGRLCRLLPEGEKLIKTKQIMLSRAGRTQWPLSTVSALIQRELQKRENTHPEADIKPQKRAEWKFVKMLI